MHKAHKKAVQFARLKKSEFKADKCEVLVINRSHEAPVPELFLDGQELLVKSFVRYLGDLFNENGNNSALIQDKTTKGKGRVNKIFTLAFKVTSGVHMIDTLLLLYYACFLPNILFNCQAWSKLLDRIST